VWHTAAQIAAEIPKKGLNASVDDSPDDGPKYTVTSACS
jgi:hypothetical protein